MKSCISPTSTVLKYSKCAPMKSQSNHYEIFKSYQVIKMCSWQIPNQSWNLQAMLKQPISHISKDSFLKSKGFKKALRDSCQDLVCVKAIWIFAHLWSCWEKSSKVYKLLRKIMKKFRLSALASQSLQISLSQ